MGDCSSCGHPIDRVLPKPIPEGEPVMWSEAVVGEALYCVECFNDAKEEKMTYRLVLEGLCEVCGEHDPVRDAKAGVHLRPRETSSYAWVECEGSGGVRRVLDPAEVVVRPFEIGSEYVGTFFPGVHVQDVIDALTKEDE